MKRLILLPALLLCATIPARATEIFSKAELQGSAYATVLQQRLQVLDSMSQLLNQVNDTASADAAAPGLLRKAGQFKQLQQAAENAESPTISKSSQLRYIQRMEHSMDAFRLACLRVAQEKCYKSPALRQVLGKINQSL